MNQSLDSDPSVHRLPQPQGKRSARRQENAKLTHNPHVTLPTANDFATPVPSPLSTFPIPLPPYLPRSVLLPPIVRPQPDPASSAAGLFSLSLRGVRRILRARPCSAPLVQAVESHLINWLEGDPSLVSSEPTGEPVGGRDNIHELRREAGRLVWAIDGVDGGGFERYVVHCVARWHNVVSFSKELDGRRLTFLLRPNSTRSVQSSLETPSATDIEDLCTSNVNTIDGSDTSEYDACDVSLTRNRIPTTVSEASSAFQLTSPSWSIIEDVNEPLASSVESLSLSDAPHQQPMPSFTTAMVTEDSIGAASIRLGARSPSTRGSPRMCSRATSTSSPSPARRVPRRPSIPRRCERRRKGKAANKPFGTVGGKGLLYDYVFA